MNHELRFTAEKIAKRLALIRPLMLQRPHPFPPFHLETYDQPAGTSGRGRDCGLLAWNSYWAGQNTHFALTSRFEVPREISSPALHLPLGVAGDIFTHPEALIRIDGQIIGSADRYHQCIELDHTLADGCEHVLRLEGWTGLTSWPPDPSDATRLQIKPCSVVDVDEILRDFVILAEVALDVASTKDLLTDTRNRILTSLDNAFIALDTRHPLADDFRASIPVALDQLRAQLSAVGSPLDVVLHGIGHAHMDVAYLWPIDQIRQKNARTYSNVLRLMDRYDTFRFSHSQPQLYAYTETDFPELFERIKQRVGDGRWEVMGGMWVEPDCNIPGGESLVRQIMLGREYFRNKFGDAETPVLWLPDTFGFPWSLPQLMRQSGLTAFVTNKLNWNQYNRMPSSTTWWQGIDGTRVLAHFLTTPRDVQHLPFPTNYKSDLSAAEVIGTWTNATTGSQVRDLPIAYGYGDGGGGPTEELLMKAGVYAAMPGVPRLQLSTVRDVLHAMHQQADSLPVWNDEFYLEGHRGTLTTQAWIKRANRRMEQLLHDTEVALVLAQPAGATATTRAELASIWEQFCVNQFHDILTGTSIAAVFEDARRDFAVIESQAKRLRDEAFTELYGTGNTCLAFNPSPVRVTAPVLVPADTVGQAVEGGFLRWVELDAYSTGESCDIAPDSVEVFSHAQYFIIENSLLRVEIDSEGRLLSVFDKETRRDAIAAHDEGNQLWAFEDRPISWDAWDIDVFHEDRAERIHHVSTVELLESGPLRAVIRISRRWRSSVITQNIMLCAGSKRLDFDTLVDWQERHMLLKVAFPTDVLSPRATYDIQWGEIERATHRNTRWDYARFEVAAQKWADLSERGFGVALLNDCKYGYDIRQNLLRLSLIKSSTSPDPDADQGNHRFTYALYSHAGDLCQVRAEARRLNDPVIVLLNRAPATCKPLISCEADNIIIETVKPAQDGAGFIIRLYESDRRRGSISLRFNQPMSNVCRCDLLETNGESVPVLAGEYVIQVSPFEIVTLRCQPTQR